ncbi:hypothetical protein ACPC54_23810 [Kitasatospora sp. NPDC094028]
MTAWIVLATCGPGSIVSILWIAATTQNPTRALIYVPPPITDEYLDQQIALLEQQWERQR